MNTFLSLVKTRMVTLVTTVFVLLQISNASAQLNFEYDPSIIVNKEGNPLQNAWAGGLDYAQFSTIDYDFDGDLDMFVFDRSNNNIRLYAQVVINGVRQWKFVYNGHTYFPDNLEYRATMVDFDLDGKNDLFTYSIGGLKVYRNTGSSTSGLQWELFKDIVYSNYNGFNSNLYVASSDIPAITDIDGDGDIDILTFHQGGQHLEYHKNLSMELYGNADSLKFQLFNECWGKFSENINNNSITLNDPNFPCQNGTLPHSELSTSNGNTFNYSQEKEASRHAGSTVLALDYDNSGVLDLIIGDVAYTNLVLLINGGSAPNTNSAMISYDTSFPSNSTPASMYLFPAAFYVDVDFDNVKDLIVGANAKNVSQNEKSILYYKNIGTNSNPTFVYKQNDFLQNQMIEHGKGSIPILYDVDNDGLTDLLVSNLYRFKNESTKESTIAYYKNTGTSTQPIYTFIDFNWLNLASQNYGLRLVPTFGDINGDGKSEMILGRENGTLVMYQNTGSTFNNPTINVKDDQNTTIQVGGYAFPQLIDINADGLLDLIIGTRTGKIMYYQNIGTATVPSFKMVNSQLGNIQIEDINNPDGYAAPHFFKHNDSLHLFLGAVDGKLYYYSSIENNLTQGESFHLVSSHFLQLDVDGFSSFCVQDIDNDSRLNLFVGQDLGGLFHFEVDPNSNVSVASIDDEASFTIFPNPASHTLHIDSKNKGWMQYEMYSINGQLIQSSRFFNQTTLPIDVFENGIYLIEITDENGRKMTQRFLKN